VIRLQVLRAGHAVFTKHFADRYAEENIRVINVLPGFVDSLPKTEDRQARIPLDRDGRAAKVSSLIAWLLSDGGRYMTGQTFRIGGGLTHSV